MFPYSSAFCSECPTYKGANVLKATTANLHAFQGQPKWAPPGKLQPQFASGSPPDQYHQLRRRTMKRISLAVMTGMISLAVAASAAQPMPLSGENPTTLKSLLSVSTQTTRAPGITRSAARLAESKTGSAGDPTCADGTFKCGSGDNFTCCWSDSQHCCRVSNSDSYYCQTNGDACNR